MCELLKMEGDEERGDTEEATTAKATVPSAGRRLRRRAGFVSGWRVEAGGEQWTEKKCRMYSKVMTGDPPLHRKKSIGEKLLVWEKTQKILTKTFIICFKFLTYSNIGEVQGGGSFGRSAKSSMRYIGPGRPQGGGCTKGKISLTVSPPFSPLSTCAQPLSAPSLLQPPPTCK